MGTNYYLKKKAEYIPTYNRVEVLGEKWYETYDFDFMNYERNKVDELTNGFVYDNTYYPTLEELNEVYSHTYHIGKSSSGWRFLLSSYPNIKTLDDWKKLFEEDITIVNEYDEQISKEEMLDEICHKEPSFEEGVTEHKFEGIDEVYEVKGGLLVHPTSWDVRDNSQEDTYDICYHWNFS